MIEWGTALHTRGLLWGPLPASLTCRFLPPHPFLREWSRVAPGSLLLQGGLTLSPWLPPPFVTMTRVGFGLVVKFLTLTKSVGMASLVPTDPTTLSSGLPRVLS